MTMVEIKTAKRNNLKTLPIEWINIFRSVNADGQKFYHEENYWNWFICQIVKWLLFKC